MIVAENCRNLIFWCRKQNMVEACYVTISYSLNAKWDGERKNNSLVCGPK